MRPPVHISFHARTHRTQPVPHSATTINTHTVTSLPYTHTTTITLHTSTTLPTHRHYPPQTPPLPPHTTISSTVTTITPSTTQPSPLPPHTHTRRPPLSPSKHSLKLLTSEELLPFLVLMLLELQRVCSVDKARVIILVILKKSSGYL